MGAGGGGQSLDSALHVSTLKRASLSTSALGAVFSCPNQRSRVPETIKIEGRTRQRSRSHEDPQGRARGRFFPVFLPGSYGVRSHLTLPHLSARA
jgi:hypothetical protein